MYYKRPPTKKTIIVTIIYLLAGFMLPVFLAWLAEWPIYEGKGVDAVRLLVFQLFSMWLSHVIAKWIKE